MLDLLYSAYKSLPAMAALVGCASGPAAGSNVPSAEVRKKICAFENIDSSSEIYVAVDAQGQPARLVVTPSRQIADHGNRVFDLTGQHLGDQTGGEFPWDDAELMAKERARVETLMGGSEVPDQATSQRCR